MELLVDELVHFWFPIFTAVKLNLIKKELPRYKALAVKAKETMDKMEWKHTKEKEDSDFVSSTYQVHTFSFFHVPAWPSPMH